MRAIAVPLVIAILALPVHARSPRLSAADTDCPDKVDTPAKTSPRLRDTTPVREATRPRPTVHGDAGEPHRQQSSRWHSFLPGMIR